MSTLSVETSTSGSSTSTLSPTFLSQRVTVPSVTDSPSSGISTGVAEAVEPDVFAAGVGSGSALASGSGSGAGSALASGSGSGAGSSEGASPAPSSAASPMRASSPPTSTVSSSWGDDLGQNTRGRRGYLSVHLVGGDLQ